MSHIEKKQVNVGLIGYGNIGTGVIRYFQQGGGEPFNINLKRVAVADTSKPREEPKFSALTDNVSDIMFDPAIDIVVELIGGITTARDYILGAMHLDKSVVTGNKAVLAKYAKEIFNTANCKWVDLGFEASVGGGIPIIRTLQGYKGERIDRILGIVNGTTNYMLTRMAEEGLDFATALKGAQENGLAEANHILDTGGFDARDKLAVLSSLICNTQIDVEKIPCRGIIDITPADMDFAKDYGYAIKLLAMANRLGNAVELQVTPALISADHPLAAARHSFNMIYLEGALSGPQTFYGKGAGMNPTTSAVISDIIRIAENIQRGTRDELPTLDSEVQYVDPESLEQKGYVRASLLHEAGSAAEVFSIIARHGLNVEDSIQRRRLAEKINGSTYVPDIITIATTRRQDINAALKEIAESPKVHGAPFFLPIIG